jgi:4-hydroxyphenylpyruvate dioxygenase
MELNPVGLNGMDFIEYCGPKAKELQSLFVRLGFKEVAAHKTKKIKLFKQGDIHFFLNEEPSGFAAQFGEMHGPSICSTGFRVQNAQEAHKVAVSRGARTFTQEKDKSFSAPTIYGIGDSLVYFMDESEIKKTYQTEFGYTPAASEPKGKGLYLIDHMTNNVPRGEMQKWCDFYENVFNFKERRYFDIKGAQTGLVSKVMRSPCGKITIPINEPTDTKSQIQEYLNEYEGSGIQHVALLTDDICSTVAQLRKDEIPVLDIPDTYYEMIPTRLPQVTEDLNELKKLQILVDGDPEGYLLQLFTQNLIGPIFFEFIQRKNHFGFGEGNFQALFEAIERDQKRRGVL